MLQDREPLVLECKLASGDRRIEIFILTGQLFTLTVCCVFFKGIYLCSLLLRMRSTKFMAELLRLAFTFMVGKILTLVVRTTQCVYYVQSMLLTLPLYYLYKFTTHFISTFYLHLTICTLDYKKYSSWIIFLND